MRTGGISFPEAGTARRPRRTRGPAHRPHRPHRQHRAPRACGRPTQPGSRPGRRRCPLRRQQQPAGGVDGRDRRGRGRGQGHPVPPLRRPRRPDRRGDHLAPGTPAPSRAGRAGAARAGAGHGRDRAAAAGAGPPRRRAQLQDREPEPDVGRRGRRTQQPIPGGALRLVARDAACGAGAGPRRPQRGLHRPCPAGRRPRRPRGTPDRRSEDDTRGPAVLARGPRGERPGRPGPTP